MTTTKTSVGIDYSMTCPAVCVLSPTHTAFCFANDRKYKTLPDDVTHMVTSNDTLPTTRYSELGRQVVDWIVSVTGSDLAVGLEDYAFAAKGRVFHIGENTAHLKLALLTAGILWQEIPPTVIKKFATGKGNADKKVMTAAFLEAYPNAVQWIPVFFPKRTATTDTAKSPLADLADAYWIARYVQNG
jgi:Holliday junction resolvasome RuvABC endonuclease subunit